MKKLTLVEDWRLVARKAWSFKLAILAALLSGLELVVPLYATEMPRGIFAGVSFVTTVAAAMTRLLAQRSMTDGNG